MLYVLLSTGAQPDGPDGPPVSFALAPQKEMLMPADLAEFTDVTCMHHRSPVRYDLRQGDCVMLKELGGKWKFATVRHICGEKLEVELEDALKNL